LFSRPSLLITDAYNVHHNPETRRTRDEKLMTNILQTLRNGGNALVRILSFLNRIKDSFTRPNSLSTNNPAQTALFIASKYTQYSKAFPSYRYVMSC
jgi:hypothetical protein